MLHQTLSFVLILACCAVTPTQTTRPTAQKAATSVIVLGDFQNVRHFRDDAFGYRLQLWRDKQQIFGLLFVYTGAPYDPPAGILEDVKFDPHTDQFSFSARLSTAFSREGERWVPTRDRFTFKGVLKRNEVIGTLQQVNVLRQQSPVHQRIKLRRSRASTQDLMPPPGSYAAWKQWADEILRRRGPNW